MGWLKNLYDSFTKEGNFSVDDIIAENQLREAQELYDLSQSYEGGDSEVKGFTNLIGDLTSGSAGRLAAFIRSGGLSSVRQALDAEAQNERDNGRRR